MKEMYWTGMNAGIKAVDLYLSAYYKKQFLDVLYKW